jgi:hypothetical protein
MVLKDGEQIDLQTWHLHLQGLPEDLYGSSGLSFASSITALASL